MHGADVNSGFEGNCHGQNQKGNPTRDEQQLLNERHQQVVDQ